MTRPKRNEAYWERRRVKARERYDRRKNDPQYKEGRREYHRGWYERNRDKRSAVRREWDFTRRAPEEAVEAPRLYRWRARLARRLAGPLRVRDAYLTRLQMWWYCVARWHTRRTWYYVTGRRKQWGDGFEFPDVPPPVFENRNDFDQSA